MDSFQDKHQDKITGSLFCPAKSPANSTSMVSSTINATTPSGSWTTPPRLSNLPKFRRQVQITDDGSSLCAMIVTHQANVTIFNFQCCFPITTSFLRQLGHDFFRDVHGDVNVLHVVVIVQIFH